MQVNEALNHLAKQTDHRLLFSYELVEEVKSSEVLGRYTIDNALKQLLRGTNLSGDITKRGVIVVAPPDDRNKGRGNMNTKKKMLTGLLGLFVGSGVGIVSLLRMKETENG